MWPQRVFKAHSSIHGEAGQRPQLTSRSIRVRLLDFKGIGLKCQQEHTKQSEDDIDTFSHSDVEMSASGGGSLQLTISMGMLMCLRAMDA